MRGFVAPRPWRLLADASGLLDRSAVRGARHFRKRRRSSRSLVEMPSSAMRSTLESMAVLLNESHAEALAEAGLEHMMGGKM